MKGIAGTSAGRGLTPRLTAWLVPLACVLLTGCPAPQASGTPEWIASVSAAPGDVTRTVNKVGSGSPEGLVAEIQIATGSVVDSAEAEGAVVADNQVAATR